MSQVLNYGGQYFRVEITEVANSDDPDKVVYVGWCSEAFKDLKDAPKQACSRFIAGPPLPTHAEALRHAYEWIKTDWDSRQARRLKQVLKVAEKTGVTYTVWLFKSDGSAGFDFEEYADATAFAKATEKSASITKVGITNNESPQYLTMWEKS